MPATAESGAPTPTGTQPPAPGDKIDAVLNAVLPLRNSQEWGKAETLMAVAERPA